MSRDRIVTDFTLEAGLYDNSKWHENDRPGDLLTSVVSRLELIPPATFQFYGYHLKGTMENPKLWSAEQVSNILIL